MNIADAILWKYPSALPIDDFIVVDHSDGNGQQIELWAVKDLSGQIIPEPTQSELDTWYLAFAKQQKNQELDAKYHDAIESGFTSSALGVAHTYPADAEAQTNFNITISRFLTDLNFTSVKFKTLDAGFLDHTRDEFYRVFADGHDFGIEQDTHLNLLKAQVNAVTIQTDLNQALSVINGITW